MGAPGGWIGFIGGVLILCVVLIGGTGCGTFLTTSPCPQPSPCLCEDQTPEVVVPACPSFDGCWLTFDASQSFDNDKCGEGRPIIRLEVFMVPKDPEDTVPDYQSKNLVVRILLGEGDTYFLAAVYDNDGGTDSHMYHCVVENGQLTQFEELAQYSTLTNSTLVRGRPSGRPFLFLYGLYIINIYVYSVIYFCFYCFLFYHGKSRSLGC